MTIRDMILTARFRLLEYERGEVATAALLQSVPGLGACRRNGSIPISGSILLRISKQRRMMAGSRALQDLVQSGSRASASPAGSRPCTVLIDGKTSAQVSLLTGIDRFALIRSRFWQLSQFSRPSDSTKSLHACHKSRGKPAG
jgi:hypothetical protein